MADEMTPTPEAGQETGSGTGTVARRMPDLVCLIAGLVSLAIAAAGFVGRMPDLPDMRWVFAGGAVLLGAALLAASVRRRA